MIISRERKVLVSLEKELKKCDEFFISVAFIKLSGITPLLIILKGTLRKKEYRGKLSQRIISYLQSRRP